MYRLMFEDAFFFQAVPKLEDIMEKPPKIHLKWSDLRVFETSLRQANVFLIVAIVLIYPYIIYIYI